MKEEKAKFKKMEVMHMNDVKALVEETK